MSWGHNHTVEFILNYDERKQMWKASFGISNTYTEVKYFKTCAEAQVYYKKNYEEKCIG